METSRLFGAIFSGKRILAIAGFASFLLFTGAPRGRAGEHECQERIAKADHRLHEAVEHHGWDSKQAEHARHELQEACEYCYTTYHSWWDEDDHRWHSYRDWDDEHGRPH